MNDERFFDLAMKACAGRCTDAERAELDSLLASRPELKAVLAKLQADARLAREVLPLLAAVESSSGEFPAYARERLQTKVRETLGRPEPARAKPGWNWRGVFGLAAGAAVVVVLLVPMLSRPGAPVVQVALLDTVGTVRGSDTNEVGFLKQQWKDSDVQTFDKSAQLEAWESSWPPNAKVAVKVVYDRAAAEVRVWIRGAGEPLKKAFPVENDLGAALRRANDFVREQTGK
jgi:hypothetical protein